MVVERKRKGSDHGFGRNRKKSGEAKAKDLPSLLAFRGRRWKGGRKEGSDEVTVAGGEVIFITFSHGESGIFKTL